MKILIFNFYVHINVCMYVYVLENVWFKGLTEWTVKSSNKLQNQCESVDYLESSMQSVFHNSNKLFVR